MVVSISYVLGDPRRHRQGGQGRGGPRPDQAARRLGGQGPHRLARRHGARRRQPGPAQVAAGVVAHRWAGRRRRGHHGWLVGPADATTRDGLSPSVLAAHPELAGYLALRLDKKTAKKVPDILKGQVAVGMYDSLNRLLDATGVQIAYVLDDLYAADAGKRAYGVTFGGRSPSYRDLGADRAEGGPAHVGPGIAGRRAGQRGDPYAPVPVRRRLVVGIGRGRSNSRYLYEVTVYVPTTGKVETTQVTDPYSVALTLDSTRSVAVDLKDTAYQPSSWRTAKAPAAQAGRRLDDLRAPGARLLGQRPDGECREPWLLPGVRRERQRHQAPQGARRRGAQHGAPAADLRHRLDPGGPGRPADPRLRPEVVRPGQRAAAGLHRPDPGQGRLQLGL